MSEVNSYIGLQQMKDIEMLIEKQRKNAQRWTEWFHENFPNL